MRLSKTFSFIVTGTVLVCLTACRSGRHECCSDAIVYSPAAQVAAPAPPPAEVSVVAPGEVAPEAPTNTGVVELFESPEAAMQAVAAAGEAGDHSRAKAIFGEGCQDLIESDDPEADGDDCARVAGMIREQLVLEDDPAGRKVAVIGKEGWRFPVPIAKAGNGWSFDLDAGREELLTREIGKNELLTVEALEEVAAAQSEYSAAHRDRNAPVFAARFTSSEGCRDGLFWESADGQAKSPIGPLIAAAAVETDACVEPVPFHGYFFKMLCPQPASKAAEIRRAERCGALAWPADYGASGIKTFMVNDAGIVFEKDLGEGTLSQVQTIAGFDPDPSWKAVKR